MVMYVIVPCAKSISANIFKPMGDCGLWIFDKVTNNDCIAQLFQLTSEYPSGEIRFTDVSLLAFSTQNLNFSLKSYTLVFGTESEISILE